MIKNLKYIFLTVLIAFVIMPNLKAEDSIIIASDTSISTSSSSFISTSNFIGDPLFNGHSAQEIKLNNYHYILFNGSSKYGGETSALNMCSTYCNSCQKYQKNADSTPFYVCKLYNLKSSYFAVHSGRVPSVLKMVSTTTFPKINASFKCSYVKYDSEMAVAGQDGLTFAGRYTWVCESKLDCERTCSGSCISPFGIPLENRDKLYSCAGRKLPNVFVNGVNADTLPVLTDKNIKDWVAKTGDGVAATLKGVLMVMNGEITCEGALGDAINIVKDIFLYIKIGAAVMLVLFTTIDFMKSVMSGEKELKAATDRFTKRAIIVVVIFMLPSLINLVLSIIQMNDGLCGL